MTEHKTFWKRERIVYRILIVICVVVLIAAIIAAYFLSESEGGETHKTENESGYIDLEKEEENAIENGIHLSTGLVAREGYQETIRHCTACHSAQLLTQNRLDKDGWVETIRWMQETQNLWDLGTNEEIIINYLTTNYPPLKKGRRAKLEDVDWYELK